MKLKYSIEGIDCPVCASKLEQMMKNDSSFESVKINFLSEKVTVETQLSEEEAIIKLSSIAKKFDKSIVIAK